MTKKQGKPDRPTKLRPDANEIAFRVLREATGEATKTKPGEGPKNPEAVARGSKGGKKGGKARAASLSAKDRSAVARKAASARWKSSTDN